MIGTGILPGKTGGSSGSGFFYDQGDLRYTVQLDDAAPVIISLREPFRSESWKQNVLRGQALKAVPVTLSKGGHTLRLKALDGHIIADQWMIR